MPLALNPARTLAALVALVGVTGCGGGTHDPDASLVDCGVLDDAAIDGASGEACSSAVDPSGYWPVRNGLFIGLDDLHALGLGSSTLDAQLVVRAVQVGAPALTAGDCVQYAVGGTGDTSRNASPDDDLGYVDAVQCQGLIAFRRSSADGLYTLDTSRAVTPDGERTLTARFVGSDGNLFEAASVPFPPILGAVGDGFPSLNGLSSVNDNVIAFVSPYGTDDARGLTAVVTLFSPSDATHLTICAVPACRGRMTIPASVMAPWAGSQSYVYGRGFARGVDFMVSGRPMRLVASSFVVSRSEAQ